MKKIINYYIHLFIDIFISKLSIFIPKENKILFISSPDFSDNSKYIYDEMIKHKLYKIYKMIWIVKKPITENYVLQGSIKYFYEIMTAKYIIHTHGVPTWVSNNQIMIFTEHGLPFKASGFLGNINKRNKISLKILSNKTDYMLATSYLHSILLSKIYDIKKKNIIITGFPRFDGLYNDSKLNLQKMNIDKTKYNKLLLYVPTFREDKYVDMSDILLNSTQFLNYLKTNNILCVYKPHKNVEWAGKNKKINTQHIITLTNNIFKEKGLHLYDILNSFDYLITDYSSIFYEASLLDIPLLFYMPDYEEYVEARGFLFEPKKWLPGKIIYNLDNLECNIQDAFFNNKYKQKRDYINSIMFEKISNCSLNVIKCIFSSQEA